MICLYLTTLISIESSDASSEPDCTSMNQAAEREMQMNDIFAAPASETDRDVSVDPTNERLKILVNADVGSSAVYAGKYL